MREEGIAPGTSCMESEVKYTRMFVYSYILVCNNKKWDRKCMVINTITSVTRMLSNMRQIQSTFRNMSQDNRTLYAYIVRTSIDGNGSKFLGVWAMAE